MQYNVYFTLNGIRYRRPFCDLDQAKEFYRQINNDPRYNFVWVDF